MLGTNVKTKKALKELVGKKLPYYETRLFGVEYLSTGRVLVVGPDAYTNRKWYAEVDLVDDIITKVS